MNQTHHQRQDRPLFPALSRRELLAGVALAGTTALASGALASARQDSHGATGALHHGHHTHTGSTHAASEAKPASSADGYAPVVVPDGWTLPSQMKDGVRVFHLVAEEVRHTFAPGLEVTCWGYNGSVHGPLIEAVEGDRVRIYVTNRLPAPTSVHWHGLILPSGMDGVGGLSQAAIQPGETFAYEFTLRQHGTFLYHAHHDEMTQMALGMTGLFVIHPRDEATLGDEAKMGNEAKPGNRSEPRPDRDFALLLHEWHIPVGASRPDPNEMSDFNILTMNGRCFPGTTPLVVRRGERVRIRIGNLSAMNHHPIHLHGYVFTVTATDGGLVPEQARRPETTVLVPVGSTRTIEFVAEHPGDWALHCHMTHHVMNQMGHGVVSSIGADLTGIDERVQPLLPGFMAMGSTGMSGMEEMGMPMPPNSIPMVGGRGPHDWITMGGMFTILKVREELPHGTLDPGWYVAPPGTQALPADAAAMREDGIDATGADAPRLGRTSPLPSNAHALPAARPAVRPAARPAGGQHEHHGHGGHQPRE